MTARQPPVEVISTKAVYLEAGNALTLPGTQCLYTGIEREQMCFGNSRPTRIRLQSEKKLKLGLSSQSISQLRYNAPFLPPTPEPLPGQVIFPEFDPGARSIITALQQGAERQREITETARPNRRLLLLHSCKEHTDGVDGEYAREENETTEWWMLEEVLYEADETDDSNEARIRYEDRIHEGIPLKPDTSYCITLPSHNKTRTSSDVPCDGESDSENGQNQDTRQESSDSEDDTASDEKIDSDSKEAIRSVADPDCIITNVEPGFEVAPEIAAYCDALEWDAFKQEPASDEEMPIDPEIIVTAEMHSTTDDLVSPPPAKKRKLSGHLKTHIEAVHEGKRKHVCNRTRVNGRLCNQVFGHKSNLKKHMETVHEGKKEHVCDWTGADGQPCHKAFGQKGDLKRHIKTVHEGKKEHVCDWTGADGQLCNKALSRQSQLKIHIETVHEGKKKHVCDKTRVDGQPCNQVFGQKNNLKTHIEAVHEGKRKHVCDRTRVDGQPCNKAFFWQSQLKTHIQTVHEGKRKHVCDRTRVDGQPCNQLFGQKGNLKKHIEGAHEGKKKHVCDWSRENGQLCNKAFIWQSQLKTHIQAVHEGKIEHVCDRIRVDGQPCNQVFSQKSNLTKHIKTIHEGKKRNRKHPRTEEADDQPVDSQQH